MIRKRGKDYWEIRVDIGRDPKTGKRLWKYTSVRGTKRDAERVEQQLKARHMQGELTAVRMTVDELLDEWLAHVRTNREGRTYDDYAYCTRRIRAAFGPMRVDRLTRAQIQRWLDELQQAPRDDGRPGNLSATTVQKHHRALHAALSYAVRMGYLGYNPADNLTLPRRQRSEPPMLTREQLEQLLEAALGTRWYPLWYVAAHTGLRVGELCGLWWEDIDWSRPAIRVRRALKQDREGKRLILGDVKNHEARVVWLDDRTAEVLDRHRAEQQLEIARAQRWEHPEHVFTAPGGRFLRPDVPTQVLRKHAKRLGLPPLSMHDLRHIHGSHLLQYHGWSITAVSERLGHYSPAFTAEVYAHVIPGAQEGYLRR
ncbi:integrase family protein [Thermaerobacter marianensis DSM 12885]|uniref:Integrase family protein n=1 Tax=Thermaerobacter marianensis (strain ATCC 700841 / DSM 12885 / JCM 10246 / 7p75a) TaxID=644966 RepID=E6SKE9_THEM7|nr:tyrosine-type recombinase/integrase [Thermaerobacter marianensis]ADU50136.1 integrase family protein [Thermaerobacter marianensis DSM 12885]